MNNTKTQLYMEPRSFGAPLSKADAMLLRPRH